MTGNRALFVALTLGALALAGCGGSSSSTNKTPDVTSDGNAAPSDPKSHILEPGSGKWDYPVDPTPAPSKAPTSRLNEVTFEKNSATLQGEASGVVKAVAGQMMADTTLRLFLVGFAHKDEKAAMGLNRANAVKGALVSAGVPISRLESSSFGNQFSAADASAPMQMRLDRRVEMWVLPQ